MPIRFRCAYCNQLMGIARRKAGTIVRCPKCAGQVVVPTPPVGEEDGPEPPEAANPGAENGGLFEAHDFEKIFSEGPAAGPQVLPPPIMPNLPLGGTPRPALPNPGLAEYEAVPLSPIHRPARGIFLTAGVLAVVSALVVVLMGMAFFLGLLLGKSWGP